MILNLTGLGGEIHEGGETVVSDGSWGHRMNGGAGEIAGRKERRMCGIFLGRLGEISG